ncbi:uncharacterized protein HaLaN_16394 [Haematococcus lacustris]|uniref:Large ribosomal subunit protein uL6c n=1 Tax=Haematococcus lacustris TaxID=44745 RepID=A0A699ZLM9_HAELA|nr:uncharacterized protein HaLaN_16394 [Haematococcus lacustris]
MLASQRAFQAHALGRSPASIRVSSAGRLVIEARESRIGAAPITVPKGVSITVDGTLVKVKGPLGELEQKFTKYVKFEQQDGVLRVSKVEDSRMAMAQHGLARSLTFNMVTGVSTGFVKKLELVGTGYRASVAGKDLTLNVGYSNPRILPIPEGLTVKVEKNTALTISGADKVVIGDFAATIRRQREPEPYKGKGVRYAGEVIKLKEGKAGGKKK